MLRSMNPEDKISHLFFKLNLKGKRERYFRKANCSMNYPEIQERVWLLGNLAQFCWGNYTGTLYLQDGHSEFIAVST